MINKPLMMSVFVLLCAGHVLSSNSYADDNDKHSLTVDLQKGFKGQRVEILLDDKTLLLKDEVHTDPSIDLAESIKVEVMEGEHIILVILDEKKRSTRRINVTRETYIGVNVSALGTLRYEISHGPYYYD